MKRWPHRYAARLFFTDLLVVAATLGIFLLRVSVDGEFSTPVSWKNGPSLPYWLALAVVGVIWLIALGAGDSRDEHVVGSGITEYDRVFRATLTAFVVVMAVGFFFRMDLARTLFLVAFPAGFIALIVSRWLWRQWLRSRQRRGLLVHRAIVIGELRKTEHIIHTLSTSSGTGTVILGAVTEPRQEGEVAGVPLLGKYRDLERIVDETGADTVIFAGADDISPKVMRRIGWQMADRDVQWIVAPAMTGVAGPRIHARPVAGMPLVHVSFPKLDGASSFIKRLFDLVVSFVLLAVLSPVLLLTAIGVVLTSRGPVFYRQERVGRNGRPFKMTKFRSMRVGADAELQALLEQQGNADTPLHKVQDDPRITRFGRFIRKFSIDELPQLYDVLIGNMSLVGPRPQRPSEVALYDDAAQRRLMVKPGMSGLWQVSGRSALSWDDALRLDLYYVENWSFMQDMVILFRTFKAIVAPGDSAH